MRSFFNVPANASLNDGTTIFFFLFLTSLFCFAAVPPKAFCKELVISSDMQFDYATQLFEKKEYDTALTEFKRFIHFFPDDARIADARFHTGLSLYGSGRFYEAAKVFNDIIVGGSQGGFGSDIQTESYFFQSRSFQKMGNLGYAQIVLINFLKLTQDNAVRDKIYSALADLCVASYKGPDIDPLNAARQHLLNISDEQADLYNKTQRLAAVEAALAEPEKNPVLAGVFAIIPGAGFFYCEKYRESLVAFLLNTGLIMASYKAFDHDNPALGSLLGIVETGFYTGNIYGSISAAHKHNRNTKLSILNHTFNLFSGVDARQRAFLLGLSYEF